jgi:hypothetical protein
MEEIEIGPKSIEGVGTSTAAFIGECERGPTEPTLVTGLEQYRRLFGSYAWKTNGQPSTSLMRHAVEGFFGNGGQRCFVTRVTGDKAVTAKLSVAVARGDKTAGHFVVEALGGGSCGNSISIIISKASVEAMPMAEGEKSKLFRAVVEYWKDKEQQGTEGATPWLQEVYDNVSTDPGSPDYVVKRITGYSSLITVSASEEPDAKADETISRDDLEPSGKVKQIWLTNGSDADRISLPDYKGSEEPGRRTGLAALETVDEVAIVCAPNAHEIPGLDLALVTHCERLKDRFAILQTSRGPKKVADLAPPTDSMFAAYYYSWIRVVDGGTGVARFIPAVGHLAGIYARTDVERGVHKAPANEVVRGALGVEVNVTRGEQEILNPRGVNCIRVFPGRGIRVWGARTMSSDPLWKYINVRRFFNYLEESIEEGTQWVVFEPNNQRLWSRVRQTISGFLTTVWRDGALMGRTAKEAFFVKCDETTMTANDIETGRLIVLIGVAPVRPAEFVIFRIAQWRSGSSIEE